MNALVETFQHGDVREIRMARPPVNALDLALCRALINALEQAVSDGVRGIVLSGNGKVFTGGMDVPYLMSLGEDRDAVLECWNAFFGAARALAHSRVPVAAALTGHSPAGGCVLALCCDYRVMSRSVDPARPYLIGLNEVQVGLAAPEGIQRLMRRVVGPHRAERLLVSGELVSAERAYEIGMVDALVDGPEVVPHAIGWVQSLLKLARQPMLLTRTIARAEVVEALESDQVPLERFVEGWYSADAQATLQAFVARLRK